MASVLLADDHGLYRKGLRVALSESMRELDLLEAESFDEAWALIEERPDIDLMLLDLNMPGLTSLVRLGQLRRQHPRTRIAVISASDARQDILACLGLGLNGFISKLQPDAEIVSAVSDILRGRIYVTSLLARPVEAGAARVTDGARGPEMDIEFAKLTPRQQDVLCLLARGQSNKEIARTLRIAEATTKIHTAALLKVLGVRNRTEAALAARSLVREAGSVRRC
ncbi:response regulator transcription factor [Methylobacterium nigriterrae]|uniref:response regulator transcription factor n=1 Tax=Methylobacterium nigriterrae TaxID=3127512 RepID=UPI0030136C4A